MIMACIIRRCVARKRRGKFILARSGQRGKTRQDLSSLRQEVRWRLVWSVKLANSILHAHFMPKFNVTLCHRLALIFAAGNIY